MPKSSKRPLVYYFDIQFNLYWELGGGCFIKEATNCFETVYDLTLSLSSSKYILQTFWREMYNNEIIIFNLNKL